MEHMPKQKQQLPEKASLISPENAPRFGVSSNNIKSILVIFTGCNQLESYKLLKFGNTTLLCELSLKLLAFYLRSKSR